MNGRGLDWCVEVIALIVSRVSRVMGDRRYKIADLAREAGISRSTATKLYYGGTDVNLSVVDRVCKALGAGLCELFEYVPDGGGETRETLYGQVGESERVASRVKAIQTQSNRVGYQVGM